jgi:nucleoside-diphosphate kinase
VAAGLVLDRVPTVTEQTLVLLKPDAVRRGLIGEIVGRYEARGLTVVAMQLRSVTGELADRHYPDHLGKSFYPALRDFVVGGPLVAIVLEGDDAVAVVRTMNGATDGRAAAPGSIRGDLCLSNRENLVHGSDSVESARREIDIWFSSSA